MALPVILVDSATGSDTAASGAGPATAITGAAGQTRNTASQLRFGLFGATDDLSGVSTGGDHALYAAIATAGQRNFSAITSVKNTRQTGSGATIGLGSAALTVSSTTGWTANDIIKVTGAGSSGGDLITTVNSVDSSTTATLASPALTAVSGQTWENPKQVGLDSAQGMNTPGTNTAWAIGGKRATVGGTNSAKLFSNNSAAGDAMPGWVEEMQSGHNEVLTTGLVMRRAGDLTSGPIILRGASGAATLPILRTSTTLTILSMNSSAQQALNFQVQAETATVNSGITGAGGGSAEGQIASGIKLTGTSTNKFTTGISNVTVVIGCDVSASVTGINMPDNGQALYNYVHGCTGVAVAFQTGMVIGNVISTASGTDGVTCNSTLSGSRQIIMSGNTIDGGGTSTGSGIKFTATLTAGNASVTPVINNNTISNCGAYDINFSSGSPTLVTIQASCFISNNNSYNNTSGNTGNPATCNSTNNPGLNPTLTNAAGGDFSIGTNLKAKGYPLGGTLTVGTYSSTYSYTDIGAAQRQEATPPVAVSKVFQSIGTY